MTEQIAPTFNIEVSDPYCGGKDEFQQKSTTTHKNTLRKGKTKSLSNVKAKAKTEWSTTPPRPPNAWILYRSIKLKEMKAQPDFPPKVQKNTKVSNNDSSDSSSEVAVTAPIKGKSACLQAEVSRIISTMWKNENAKVKADYVKMAEDRKKQHTDMFPDYKYKPKRQKSSSSMTKSLSMNHYSTSGEIAKGKKMRKFGKAKGMLTVDAERAEYLARLHPRQPMTSSDYDAATSDYSPFSSASVTLPSFYQHVHHHQNQHHQHPDTVRQNQLEWDQSDAISESNSMNHHHHQHGLNDWSVALAATMNKAEYDQQIKKERLEEMEMHFSDLDGSTPSTSDSVKLESSFSSSGGANASDYSHHQHTQPNYFGSFGPDHTHHASPSDIKFTSQLPQSRNTLDFTPVMLHHHGQIGPQKQSQNDQHQVMTNNAFPNSWQAVTSADFLPYLTSDGSANCSSSIGSQSIPYSPSYQENELVSPTSSAFQQQSTIGDATIFLSQLNVGPAYGRNSNGISAEDLAILNNINPASSSTTNQGNALHPHPSGLSPHQIRQQQYQWAANENNMQHSFSTSNLNPQQYQDGLIDASNSNQLLRPTLYRSAHSDCGHDRVSLTPNSALSSPALSPTNFNRQDHFNGGNNQQQNLFPPNSFPNALSMANEQQHKQQQQFSMPSQW